MVMRLALFHDTDGTVPVQPASILFASRVRLQRVVLRTMTSQTESAVDTEIFPEEDVSFEVNEHLTNLEAIQKYTRSSYLFQRIPFIKAIAGESSRAEPSTITEHLVPLVEELSSDDSENIRMEVADILEPVGRSIHEKCSTTPEPLQTIVQSGLHLLRDTSTLVREVALSATTGLAPLLSKLKQMEFFSAFLEDCLACNDVVDRVSGVLLLTRLCEQGINLGSEENVLKWIEMLVHDSNFEVRKEMALTLPQIASHFSHQSFSSNFLPHFLALCDDKVWSVRKASAQSLPKLLEVSNHNKSIELQTTLLECNKKVSNDVSNWVKITSLVNLGPLISQLDSRLITDELIDQYAGMVHAKFGASDTTILLSCAHSLPGVVVKVGKENWGKLRDLYVNLMDSADEKVRYTLACSSHELAKVLPETVVESDVLPGVVRLMCDPSPVVRMGVVKYLTPLLQCLTPSAQNECLAQIDQLIKPPDPIFLEDHDEKENNASHPDCHNTRDWRIRKVFSEQICSMTECSDPPKVIGFIMPCAFQLCNDSVAVIREEAGRKLGLVLKYAESQGGDWTAVHDSIVNKVCELGSSGNFRLRCSAICICDEAVKCGVEIKNFEKLRTVIDGLSGDPVLDVRRAFNSSSLGSC